MTSKVSPGTCLICRAPVTEQNALEHGMACLPASDWPTGEDPSFLIMVQGDREREYWMLVLARQDALLGDLDQLLRDVWVECCGHPASFLIEEILYEVGDEADHDASDLPLVCPIVPDSTFIYDYGDFDSTTTLELTVIGETPLVPPDGPLCLIARNDPPKIPCDLCGGEAIYVLEDYDEETLHHYCRECLAHAGYDPDDANSISNSPRSGICGYIEDPDAAVLWYPPGWSAGDIASGEPGESPDETPDTILSKDIAEIEATITAIIRDTGPHIDAFVEAEWAVYGDKGARMARDTVMAFCTFMRLTYGAEIDDWDAPSVQQCLVEELSKNPLIMDAWLENAVPILCRFLKHMEEADRITNASGLIAALEEAEPAFKEAVINRQKDQDIFEYLLEKLEDSGIDLDDLGAVANFAMKELLTIAGFDSDDERFHNLTQGGTLDNYNDDLRITMIVARCEEFHDQFEDDAVIERCREIAGALSVHPDSPLLRGDPVLWSAGIIYAACQDMGLIRRGRSAPPVVEAISYIFGFERASLQNKARSLRAFLPD